MPDAVDYHSIYAHRARDYDAMVAAEDVDGNLPRALAALTPGGARVLEVGCGTGRVTRILLDHGARVFGFDRSPSMLALARERLAGHAPERWSLARADVRALPVAGDWADLAIAGWAVSHLLDETRAWRDDAALALAGMERALRPGGRLVLIETLGFAVTEPHPPTTELAAFYDWLEGERGLRRQTIRTDFQFPDAESAARGTGFFFGPELARRIRERDWARVPECTGIWSRTRE